jgi:hypothetical protein
MKSAVAVGFVLVLAGAASAQERIPHEDALKYAGLFVEKSAKASDLQIKVEPDAKKPYGLHQENMGTMAIPTKTLSAETLRNVGKEVTPLAQLWARNLTLVHKDLPVANDRLRLMTISIDDQEHTLPLFLLGARKKEDGSLELLVYAKGKAPILSVPLGRNRRAYWTGQGPGLFWPGALVQPSCLGQEKPCPRTRSKRLPWSWFLRRTLAGWPLSTVISWGWS